MKTIGIIGGGIVGLAAANKLSHAGYQITIFNFAQSASAVAPGVNSIKGLFRGNTPLFQEKIYGHHRLWQELVDLEKKSGVDLELRKTILEPFKSRSELNVLGERAFHNRFLGLFGSQITAREESLASLHPEFLGSIVHTHDFSFHPLRALDALRMVFLNYRGGEFSKVDSMLASKEVSKKVIRVKEEEKSFVIYLADGTKAYFDEVILAAGASTPLLLQASGFPIEGFRFKAGVALEAKSSVQIGLKRGQTSLNANGRELRFGAKDFSVPSSCDFSNFEDDFKPEIDKYFLLLLGDLKDLTSEFESPRPIGGVRLEGPNRSPFVQRLSSPGRKGLIVASGFHKSGWSLAWGASDSLLKMIQ